MSSDEENERLLGQSRKQDDAAVRILKPHHQRQDHGMSRLLRRGGPQPTNTLNTSPYFSQRNEPRTTSFKPKSRSSNPSTPSTDSFHDLQTSASHPQKRRKIERKNGTPPDSVISVSSSLDELRPEEVNFKSKVTRSQETATLGMGLRHPGNGQRYGTPDEFRKAEALFDSTPGTNRYAELSKIVNSKHSLPESVQDRLDQKAHPVRSTHHNSMRQTKQDGQADSTATNNRLVGSPERLADSAGRPSQPNSVQSQYEADKANNLNNAFRTTEGERRGISATSNQDSLSPDELEGPFTSGPTVIALSSPTKRGRSASPAKSVSPVKAASFSSRSIEPSNIKPSAFQSGRRARKKIKRSPDFDSDVEETPIWSVPVTAINVPGRPDMIVMKDVSLVWRGTDGQFLFMRAGESIDVLGRTAIQPKKLQRCLWERGGQRIRLEHSQDNSGRDRFLEFELGSEKNVSDLLQKIQKSTPVTTVAEESEKMGRIFRKRRVEGYNNNTSSRRDDGLPDDVQMASINQSRLRQKSHEIDEGTQHVPSSKLVSELVSRSKEPGTSDDSRSGIIDRASSSRIPTAVDSRAGQAAPNPFKRQLEHNNHLRRSTRHSAAPSRLLEESLGITADLETERYSKTHGLGDVWRKPLSYPKVGKKKATVEFEDLERLDEGQFLNDNLISFYLRFLEHELEMKLPELSKRVYFFNTFFYERLTSSQKGHKGINYEGVQKWTRTIDLFTYDFVIVPINELSHWYVAVICNLPALDRRMATSEEPSSQPEVHITNSTDVAGKDSYRANQFSASPERETTNSFAEMTLEGKPRAIQADSQESLTLCEDDEGQRTELKDDHDDGEMLDILVVPNNAPLVPATQAQPMVLDHERPSDPIEDPDDGVKGAPSRTRQKRKSAPIMCRNPDLPAIVTFDSLDNPHSQTVRLLKQYLVEEGKAKRGGMQFDEGQIKGVTAKSIPLQSNFSDCGLFMLGYVEKMLSSDPREFISRIIRRDYDVANDWPRLVPSTMRANIREQLQKLHEIEQDERRDLARKAGKLHGAKSTTETSQDHATVSQQPNLRVKTNGAGSIDVGESKQNSPSSMPLSENAREDQHDHCKIAPSCQGPEKDAPTVNLVDKSKTTNTDDQSLIIVESEPQTLQAEQPPSSLPPNGTIPTLSLAHNKRSSRTPPAEIPESQSQSQSCSPSHSKDFTKGSTQFPVKHPQGSESAINGLPELDWKGTRPIVEVPVSPSRTKRARRPSKVVEFVGQRTSPRFDVAKTTTPVINLD